jgi:hypothetical protein
MKPGIFHPLRGIKIWFPSITLAALSYMMDKPTHLICNCGLQPSAVRRLWLSRFHPETVKNPGYPVDPVKKYF